MKRRRTSPKIQMVIALRGAAANIESHAMRKAAAADADRIPRSLPERFNRGTEGRLMPYARGLLRALPNEQPRNLAGCARMLRDCADMLAAPPGEVFDTWLGQRRRKEPLHAV